jgi:formylglycine-generating enzyme required for sulfatase activity
MMEKGCPFFNIRVLVAALLTAFSIVACQRAENMVYVPEGEFTMGTNIGEPDERPERKVYVKAFYIDRYEVTNGQYARFVEKTKRKKPKNWEVEGLKEDKKNHPVVFVTYADARSFCEWAGKRLPTEEEWEKAARGADGRPYPWGKEFNAGFANTSVSGIVGTAEVGRFEKGASPYGAHDMAGNVWEWTESEFTERAKVVRGGSWGLTHRFARSFFRVGYTAGTAINNLGFRCAK